MELSDSGETVTETLWAEIQQGLHKDVDFQRIEAIRLFVFALTGKCVQHSQYLLRGTLTSYRDNQFVSCCGPRQRTCNSRWYCQKIHLRISFLNR